MAIETAVAPDPVWVPYAALDASVGLRLRAASSDLRIGALRWRAWTFLAIESVKAQYRRTRLGPWWLTLQTAAYVGGLGVVFSQILHTSLKHFLPYVSVGLIVFGLMTGLVQATANSFVNASATMRSTRQTLSQYVLRDVTIQLVQFAHNLVLYVGFLAAGLVPASPKILLAIPMIAVIAVNGLFVGLWLGPAIARFRDLGPVLTSLLQALVFFSPVFYRVSNLGGRRHLVDLSPFTYFLTAVRAPLIGAPLEAKAYIGVAVITVANVLVGLCAFSAVRSRLPYWVA